MGGPMGRKWVMRQIARRHAEMETTTSNVMVSPSMPHVDVDNLASSLTEDDVFFFPLRKDYVFLNEDVRDDDEKKLHNVLMDMPCLPHMSLYEAIVNRVECLQSRLDNHGAYVNF
jgi:hypothetical protein